MYLKLYSIEHSAVATSKASKKIYPRPYQLEGIKWLRDGKRVMLTDWPGLGKTLQSGEATVRPCLVSAPTYLTQQWYNFLRDQYPDDKVVMCTGPIHRFDRQARLKVKGADWYIINHAMFRNFDLPPTVLTDGEGHEVKKGIRTVILDESHHFRNRTALQSIGAAKYTANMDVRVYLLTASPVWKNTDDIWMQLHILQPELFSSYNDFIDYFMIVDESLYGPRILGVKRQVKKELDALLSVVKFGRTYKQVGRYLPTTIKSEIGVPFPPELARKYKEIKSNYWLQIGDNEALIFSSYIEVLHTLRAITNWPGKQDALLRRLEDIGKPAIIFTWYKETAYQLGALLRKQGMKQQVLTGDTKPDERLRIANAAHGKGQHIVANLHALSEGVNLQDYRHVIFYECDWPPGKNFQALSRVVRDRNDNGRDKEPVLVDYLLVPETVDTVIYKVAQQREASIKDLMQEILM